MRSQSPNLTAVLVAMVAMVAIASGCKKESPTEPGAPSNAITADAAVLGGTQSSALAACGGPAVVWKGLRHTSAGQAQLNVIDDANPMIVDGIGTSGRDGVCTSMSGANSAYAVFPKYDGIDGESNDAIVVRTEWQIPGGRRYQSGFSMTPANGLIVLSATMPQMNCRKAVLEFLLADVVVGSGQVACATGGTNKGAYPVAVLSEIDLWEHWTLGDNGFQWGVSQGGEFVRANLPGRPMLAVDEIRIIDPAAMPASLVRSMITVTDAGTIPGRLVIVDFAPIVP